MTNKIISLVLFLLVAISCTVEEGPGGSSEIYGKLVVKKYNDDKSLLLSTEEAKDEDIFLIYGDETVVGEDTKTSYSGNFRFQYLWPGNYTLYYFSEEVDGSELEVKYDIELEKGEKLDLGELVQDKVIGFDDGNASISGRVFLVNYRNESEWPNMEVKDTSLAQDWEVYLVYGEHKQYDLRIRTNHDGTFEFNNLIAGDYLVYLYSEDLTGATQDIVIKKEVKITEDGQEVSLGDIYVEKI